MTDEDWESRLDILKHEGYLILASLCEQTLIDALREEYLRLKACEQYGRGGMESIWIRNMTELAPDLTMQVATHATLLGFLERTMGPFVQIDSAVLAGFPPGSTSSHGQVSAWHRDRQFGEIPVEGVYIRPHSMIFMMYLSDLTDDLGPLRIIPGSHCYREVVTPANRQIAHPDERLIYSKSGDAVLFHDGVLHSGTTNVSTEDRCFFGITFNMTWMRQEDDFSGPNCLRLIRAAEANENHQMLRLLGIDKHRHRRLNSRLIPPDEKQWRIWISEEQS